MIRLRRSMKPCMPRSIVPTWRKGHPVTGDPSRREVGIASHNRWLRVASMFTGTNPLARQLVPNHCEWLVPLTESACEYLHTDSTLPPSRSVAAFRHSLSEVPLERLRHYLTLLVVSTYF